MNKLVIIDMQNDFITGSLGSKQAQDIVPNIIEKIKSKKFDEIILTQDIHSNCDYLNTQEGKKLPILHCILNTEGCEIEKNIIESINKNNIKHYTVAKTQFGSFSLLEYFDKSDIITICGVATDICVITNALLLKTEFPENQIIVDSKCCAGITAESHEAALQVLKMCQIEVIE